MRLDVVASKDLVANTAYLFAMRHARAYRLLVRDTLFSEIRFTSTAISSALRTNDPVIRWFCGLIKEISEGVRDRLMRSQS